MKHKYQRGKKLNSREVEVSLSLPPGDYSKIDDENMMQMRLSRDMSSFIEEIPEPSLFYLVMKQYFSERKNLHKLICNDLKEACVHTAIIGVMTQTANIANDDDLNVKETAELLKKMRDVLKTLRAILKNKARIKDWDEYCASTGEICSGSFSRVKQNDSDEEEWKTDTHLSAES